MNIRYASTGALLALLVSSASAQTGLRTVQIASGLSRPLDVQTPKGDRARLFIVEQTGRIKIVKNGQLLSRPFLDLSGTVACCSERGLLGLAFHPNYAQNGHFFVNYTTNNPFGATVVERYTVSANPDVANPGSRKAVFGPLTQPYANHNGGCIAFGKDGYLYIGTGDGGSGGDPGCRAQNGQSFHGKMLRIDIDTNQPYVIPPKNPFVGNASFRDEIFHYGLRNPWRFSFDRETGDMWIGDVGQTSLEEISFASINNPGGLNFGWKIMEGTFCYGSGGCSNPPACGAASLKNPLHVYGRTAGRSVTGGYVYRGCAIPDLRGTYFFADYVTNRIWSFRRVGGRVTQFRERTAELGWTGSISSFGEDDCGEIYICRYSSFSGSVHKIVPNAPPPVVDLGYGKTGGNGEIPEFTACGLLNSGSSAEFRLYNAPANSQSLLMLSLTSRPIQLFGGTIATFPILESVVLPTAADGTVKFTAPGGQGPRSIYAQFLLRDSGATFGIGISNALRVDLQR